MKTTTSFNKSERVFNAIKYHFLRSIIDQTTHRLGKSMHSRLDNQLGAFSYEQLWAQLSDQVGDSILVAMLAKAVK